MEDVQKIRVNTSKPHTPNLPGSEGVWILIFGDMMVFGLFFGTYLFYRSANIEMYYTSQSSLNEFFGLLNTIVLLTSSWFVVWAVRLAKSGAKKATANRIVIAILLGLGFCVVKGIEYSAKFSEGHTIISNEFFMFYFMLTGIHLVHVTIGLGALSFVYFKIKTQGINENNVTTLETSGIFWHLVDLLWVVLFALLYLVR
ncbi:MAG: hypothetical protein COA43_00840 [Robiginitomaculum sp.]|nr:MAG: hypothetical protein COA43_00840 [Robiginitomaculum sp.]